MRTKSKGKGQGAKVKVAGVLLLVSAAAATQGTITLEPARDVRQFDAWIYVLMDSAVCETCVSTDNRGVLHRVWTDSGRVMYQSRRGQSQFSSDENQAVGQSLAGRGWSQAMRLSLGTDCESPLVFERREPGQEPFLVTMWRGVSEGRVDVMCRYRLSDAWPLRWGPAWNVTIRP